MLSKRSSDREDDTRKLIEFVMRIGRELRRKGVRVSTSELIDAAIILENYIAVRGTNLRTILSSKEDLFLVLASTLAKRKPDLHVLKEIIDRTVDKEGTKRKLVQIIESEMKKAGITYNTRINHNKKRQIRSRQDALEAYSRLKLLGIIRHTRHGEKVVSRKEAIENIQRIIRNYGNINNALRAKLVSATERGDDIVLSLIDDALQLNVFNEAKLDSILIIVEKALRKGAWTKAKEIAKIFKDRINNGEKFNNYNKAYSVLRRFGLDDLNTITEFAARDSNVAIKLAQKDKDKIINALRSAPLEKIARIIASLARDTRTRQLALDLLDDFLREKGSILLEYVLPHIPSIKDGVFRVLSMIHDIEMNVLRGLVSGEDAYIDYAFHQLHAATRSLSAIRHKETFLFKTISYWLEGYNLILKNVVDTRTAVKMIGFIPGDTALTITRLYSLSRSTNKEIKLAATRLLHIVLSQSIRRMKGSQKIYKKKYTIKLRDRYTRPNPYHLTRFFLIWDPTSLRYKQKTRRPSIVVVLDKSGSMRPYSIVAMLAAAAFAGVVDKIVLFDSNTYIYSNKSTRMIHKMLEMLLSTEFDGYTDIIKALREAAKHHKKTKIMVVVSDLRQTVRYRNAHIELINTIHELYKQGWRLFIIAPPTVDRRITRIIQDYVHLRIVATPSDVEKVVKAVISTI